MTNRLDLRACRIIAPADRPGWVDQAVLDLADCTRGRIVESLKKAGPGATVLVAKQTVRDAYEAYPALRAIGLDGLSDQGFVLETVRDRGVDLVVCSGGGSRGDAYAVIELIKALDKQDGRVLLGETSRREEPFFVRRGIYAHQHWAYAYPYALRTWKLDDWRRYIDLLAYLKINFFQIWSMAGILPNPLSPGDREYLENYHAVIDYAKNRRGMEVFIGECANNVAESDGGVPIQQRGYFDVEVLKDPSDARQFREVMANRRNLYTVADNADGYWIIDSDPGGFPESPTSEFVDILIGNRKLIDEHTRKGKDAKLAYWMWQGWGKGKPMSERMDLPREALEDMRDRLKEPWVLLTCWPSHLGFARDLGYIDKSIFFPYGTIEDEPSPPTTRLRMSEMYAKLDEAISVYGIRNAMGNAQTPLVQLPNIFFFAEAAWNGLRPAAPADREVIEPLAALVAPDVASEIADGWLALNELDPDRVLACAAELASIVAQDRARLIGPLGMRYFPGVSKLLSDLAMQLDAHAKARLVVRALSASAPQEEVAGLMANYFGSALAWRDVHDFRNYMNYGPDAWEIGELWKAYRSRTAPDAGWLAGIRERLTRAGHAEAYVDGFLELVPTG